MFPFSAPLLKVDDDEEEKGLDLPLLRPPPLSLLLPRTTRVTKIARPTRTPITTPAIAPLDSLDPELFEEEAPPPEVITGG